MIKRIKIRSGFISRQTKKKMVVLLILDRIYRKNKPGEN